MKRERILIVEDELSVARLISSALEYFNYEVAGIVTTGEDAIAKVNEGNIDLVLMDIVLSSEMTGTEAADKIRIQFDIPIIFLTAYLNESLLNHAKQSEPFGYLLKPFNERELYASIEMALYKHKVDKLKFHLNNLMKIARKINQLIIRENNSDTLIKGICKSFAETGFNGAGIFLLDDSEDIVTVAEDGLDNKYKDVLINLANKDFPAWILKSLAGNGIYEVAEIKEDSHSLPFLVKGMKALNIRIESVGRIFGLLTLITGNRSISKEEKSLLKSITTDIAFSLNNIELQIKNKNMRQALSESEKRYRQVVENAVDIIFTTDINGNFTYVNKAGLVNTGYAIKEIIGKNCMVLILPEHRKRIGDFYIKQYKARLSSAYIEYPFYDKLGEVKWYGQNSSLIIENEKPVGFYCIAREITERKKIENALLESEKRYRQLVELSPDAIIVHTKGKIVFANDACLNLFGAKNPDDLINKSITELMLPDYIDISRTKVKTSEKRSGRGAFLREQKFLRLDGSQIDVEITTSPIVFQNENSIQIVIRDISERKMVEDELRKRQSEVITLLDSLPAFAFFKDAKKHYIIANQRFCDAMGCTKDQITGKTDYDFLPKEIADKYDLDDQMVISSGEMLYVREEQIFIDNKYVTIGTRKVPLKDESGKVFGLIGLAFDITERKEAEEAIKKYSKELEELNASKDKFFSIISHDLRSPFQGLLGLSSVMVDEYDKLTQDEFKLFLSNINNSAKNLYSLIENLLQWSRIQRGKIELSLTKIDLYDEVLYNINLLQRNAANKNIQIINETQQGTYAKSDINIFNSTIQNLISNAIKFTKPGGRITISSDVNSQGFIELTVSDTGVGISEDDLAKLFRIDTQHSTLGTERESGTGLGLIICKELMEMQGGKIHVKSKPGEGTAFTITLQHISE